jgi:hypothetical protein
MYPFSMHQPSNASDGHRSNIPERATGRSTSPIVHSCPTPHYGKTRSRPPPSHELSTARGTRPTDAAHPLRQVPSPRTHVIVPTPVAYPHRTCAPRMQARPEHTRPRVHTVGPRKQGFLNMSAVRADSGNETAASAHGMTL